MAKILELFQKNEAMKNYILLKKTPARIILLSMMMLSGIFSFAQDSLNTSSNIVTTTTTTEEWYTDPLYIIIGIAFLLLITILLTRSKRKN